MRDIVLSVIVFGLVPFIIAYPHLGILVWSWLSYMNPHRLTWGFAQNMPFAQIVAIATLISIILSTQRRRIPFTALTVVWLLFILWMGVTTVFSLVPENAWPAFERIIKIQLITFITMVVMYTRERLIALVWVIVLSIGFFSVKGGVFTLLSDGSFRVWGPPDSYIRDNNSLALATLMIMPLLYYFFMQTSNRWLRMALLSMFVLSLFSVLGAHSRSAIVTGLAMSVFFWLKSKKKMALLLLLLLAVPLSIGFMPEKWAERISTIFTSPFSNLASVVHDYRLESFDESKDRLGLWPDDRSALGRVNAWNYAVNVANDRLTGAGAESWEPETFARYAPIPRAVHSSHSIYFGILADHGWLGLTLFVLVLLLAWRSASRTISLCKRRPDLDWLTNLVRMIQVSMIAYCSGGAFLALAYFDLPWHLIAIVMLCEVIAREQTQEKPQRVQPRAAPAGQAPPRPFGPAATPPDRPA